jgi:nucleotide-binding universal stress UspA family protein
MMRLDRILVPTDFSECAAQAIEYASEFAIRFNAKLQVLHVVPEPVTPYTSGIPLPKEAMHPEIPAAKELDSLQVPRSDEIPHLERAIEMGVPFVEIVRHARQKNIDLIVIGTHGRTGLDQMLMGSVAEKVVRKAPCPVLTVRPEGHQFVMP